MGVIPRVVLSAPSSQSQAHVLNIVIFCVSFLSLLGAGWIVISFGLFKPLRSFRHQLILGLALSDFWMAANFLSSSSISLFKHGIDNERDRDFCSFNGFMIQLFVVQTDYWILIIAICTYLKLADHKVWIWVEQHKILVWIFPWLISISSATVGLLVWDYRSLGAWCWLTNDRIRLYLNFIPRWLIVLTILSLYLRLYILIHRVQREHHTLDSNAEDMFNRLDPDALPMSASKRRESRRSVFSSVAEESWINEGRPTSVRTSKKPPTLSRVSYRMMAYPLFYMLIWIIPTTIRIYQTITDKHAPFGIATVDKACVVIQGFVDALVYGFNERTWKLWRALLTRAPPPPPAHIYTGDRRSGARFSIA